MYDAYKHQIASLISQGHSTHAIAEALECPLEVVRAVAGECGEAEVADMMGVLKSVAADRASPAAARVKAATYVINEARGRNDRAGAFLDVVPVVELATRLMASRARALPAAARRASADASNAITVEAQNA